MRALWSSLLSTVVVRAVMLRKSMLIVYVYVGDRKWRLLLPYWQHDACALNRCNFSVAGTHISVRTSEYKYTPYAQMTPAGQAPSGIVSINALELVGSTQSHSFPKIIKD